MKQGINVEWLLNYRGGSFLIDNYSIVEKECKLRGVLYESVNELLKINISPADFSNSRRNLVLKIIINKPITFKKSINLSLDTDVLLASLKTFLKLLKLGKNKFITCFTIYILHAL